MRTLLRDDDVRFSLVLATVGRTRELANFLAHLTAQSCPRFELVVVDQNQDERLLPVLAEYLARFPIQHLRSATGLSHARNVGLRCTSGNIVAFPDDDCWYPPDLLERVAKVFAANPEFGAVTGRPIDTAFSRFHKVSGAIDKQNLFLRCSSFTMFLRRNVVDAVGQFDEGLGLGSTRGRIAGEETDYLLRALEAGFQLHFDAAIEVFHQETPLLYDGNFNDKARGYNTALGYLLRKHRYSLWYAAKTWIRAFGGMCLSVVSLDLPKARYHANVLAGRVVGYLSQR
jgi:glycosyltransferase involved in cell wall biosynthesis